MEKGINVIYNGKKYIIVHIYDSNYCEIKQLVSFNVELVHKTELKEEK